MSSTDRAETVKRRTVVHIDRKDYASVVCTVSGVDLPVASVRVSQSRFPAGSMWLEAAPGKVFFAYANLNAKRAEDVGGERIEREWGAPDGPLHFEADDA